MRNALRAAALAALLVGCGDSTIDAPLPRALGDARADTALTLSPSVIDLPVEYDLGPALAWLETVVPVRLGDIEARQEVPDNSRLSFAFEAERTPFRMELNGTTVTLSAVVSYGGRGWYNPPILPTISGSCGLNEERPRVHLAVRTTVTPTANWQLRSQTRVLELRPLTSEPRDQCKVTAMEINVTERVLEAVRGVLDERLVTIDEHVGKFPLRGMVEDVWGFLSSPVRLQDSLWLLVDPAAVRFDAVRSEGNVLHSALGITAYPRVVSGPRPDSTTRPVPPFDRVGSPPGLSLLSEGAISWEVLSGILTRELGGDTLRVAGRELEIAGIEVRGLGDGRVAVGLDLEGATRGKVYLVGTPQFDPVDAVLTMPDLTFDVSTRDLLVRGLAWLAGGQVEEHLRTTLRISLASVLDDGRTLLEKELSRELAPGVRIATQVERGQVVRVRPRVSALMVDAVVHGSSTLRLTMAPGRRVGQGGGGEQ